MAYYNWKQCGDISLTGNYSWQEWTWDLETLERDYEESRYKKNYEIDSEILLEAVGYSYTVSSYFDITIARYHSLMVAFTTPASVGSFEAIKFNFYVNSSNLTQDIYYSVASSDYNLSSYLSGTVSDKYIISSIGTLQKDSIVIGSTNSIVIESLKLEPSTTYYLMLYLSKDSGENISLKMKYNSIEVATNGSLVMIDSGSNMEEYMCYIDTKYAENPIDSDSCEIIGNVSVNNNGTLNYEYQTNRVFYVGENYTYWLKFKTPRFIGISKKITFNIKLYNFPSTSVYNCAICTSDANYKKYFYGEYSSGDQYQVVSATPEYSSLNSGSLTIDIDTDKLNPDTTYYLVIWYNENNTNYPSYTIYGDCSNHTVTLISEDVENPIYSSKFEKYIPYIDTGTTWEPI